MHNKILIASQSNKIIKITTKRPILAHHFYTAQLIKVEEETQHRILYKLLSSANPFITFFELYSIYALQSPDKITRQFIRFVVNCWKKYQSFQEKQKFVVDFFGETYLKMKAHVNDQVLQAVREVLSLQPVDILDQQWLEKYLSKFKTAKQIIKKWLSKQKNLNNQDQLSMKLLLLPKMERQALHNLQNINVLKSSLKISILQKICRELPSKWEAQLYFDQNKQSAYILTHKRLEQDEQFVPFNNFLHPFYRNQSNIKQYQIQNLAFATINKLQYYNKKCSYKLSMNPSDFLVIVKKNNNIYELSKKKCQINYISPFLQYLGLNSLSLTGQNKLVFQSRYQPLYRKADFTKQLPNQISPDKIQDTNNAIKWIIYFDHVFCKLFGKGKSSLLESYSSNDRKWEKYILDKIVNHQYVYNETYLFHSWTICVLDCLLKNVEKKEEIFTIINSHNIRKIFQQLSKEKYEQQPFNPNRVDILVKMLQFQQNLYFSSQGLRFFFLHNKNLSQLLPQQRYLCLYYLAILVELNALYLLSTFKIRHKQDFERLQKFQEKFKNIIKRLAKKIDPKKEQKACVQSWIQNVTTMQQSQTNKQTRQIQLQQNINNIKNKFMNVIAKPLQSFKEKFQNLNNLSELKQNKYSLVITKACFLNVTIFTQLNVQNLLEFVFIQKQIEDIKTKQKLNTSLQLHNLLNVLQKKLQGVMKKIQIKPFSVQKKLMAKEIN